MLNNHYRTVFYSVILSLLPVTSYADVKIYFGVPTVTHNKQHYYPQNNYNRHNNLYKRNNNAYSNRGLTDLSSLYKYQGNKQEYERAMYNQKKYGNSYNRNNRRFQNSYNNGFRHGREFERKNRSTKLGD